mgnify:CR=1 FL=1
MGIHWVITPVTRTRARANGSRVTRPLSRTSCLAARWRRSSSAPFSSTTTCPSRASSMRACTASVSGRCRASTRVRWKCAAADADRGRADRTAERSRLRAADDRPGARRVRHCEKRGASDTPNRIVQREDHPRHLPGTCAGSSASGPPAAPPRGITALEVTTGAGKPVARGCGDARSAAADCADDERCT